MPTHDCTKLKQLGLLLDGEPLPRNERLDEQHIELAVRNGVSLLLLHQLTAHSLLHLLTEQAYASLARSRRMAAANDLLRNQAESEVCSTLAKHGITPILIKGAANAHRLYPSPELRPRCDTDLFIPMTAIRTTADILRSLGYTISDHLYKSHQYSGHKKTPFGVSYAFDIHWRIQNNPNFARIFTYEEAPKTPSHSLESPQPDNSVMNTACYSQQLTGPATQTTIRTA